jgi:hypothetical protein
MTSSPDSPSPHARLRRIALRTGIVLGVLALIWTAGFLIVPPIVRSQAEKAADQLLGRRLTLGRVSFNPWTLELTIENAALAARRPNAPSLLELRRVYVDAAISSLVRLAPVVDHLEIDGPALRAERLTEDTFDFDDVLQRIAAFLARPTTEPARFALHNIRVSDGSVDFVDWPAKVTHHVRGFALGIPFLSSLPSERTIQVEPHLAFTLDGSRFDSTGTATPFAQTRRGESRVHLEGFDIAPWLNYLPRGLPARPRAARIGTDLTLAWEQQPRLSLRIAGTLQLDGIEIVDAASHRLLDIGSVHLAIDELRPLESTAKLARLDIDAPRVLAERDANGRLNLLLEATGGGETRTVAPVPLPPGSAASGAPGADASAPQGKGPAAQAPGWRVSLAALSLRAGHLDWRDATTAPATALALADVTLDAQALGWPLDAPVAFKGEGRLDGASKAGRLSFSGQGNAATGHVDVKLQQLPLDAAQPYVAAVLASPLAGVLDADVGLDWKEERGASGLAVDARQVSIDALRLGAPTTPDVAIDRVLVEHARLDTAARRGSVARATLAAPRLRLERTREGTLNVAQWTRAPSRPAAPADPGPVRPAPAKPDKSTDAWSFAVDDLAIEGGRIGFVDRAPARPVAVDLADLGLHVQHWALNSATPASFRIGVRVQSAAAPSSTARAARTPARTASSAAGSLEASGELGALSGGVPSEARAKLLLRDLPVHLAQPYLASLVDFDLQRALASFRGDVTWDHKQGGEALHVHGDASLDSVRAGSTARGIAAAHAVDAAASEPDSSEVGSTAPLFSWKSLSVRGIDVALAPGTVTRVAVGETALTDFSARLVLDENGRLNLQDVTPRAARSDAAVAAPAAAASASTPAAAASPPPVVDVGSIVVVNGRVDYRDLFVRPNYRTDLSEVNGRLGAFSSRPPAAGATPALAELEVRARAEGTAAVAINGRLNPLARPPALDLKATVRELELPPLSPYSVKYTGYGITHGKLSADLAYEVAPDGRLTATNRVVLNQLTFGDKDPAATTSLPVKLAVALLADHNGVVELNLPVSGSINDPQFSVGGIIAKAIGNLVLKAVTSPFTLLASSLGGGGAERPSHIEFAPGSAALDAAAREHLDAAAKALVQRPAVHVTVSGEARLAVEGDAWRRERLQQMLRAEKRRQATAQDTSADAEIVVSDAEKPALLKAVYQRANINKPRNVLGIAKDVSPEEMQALLLASMQVDDDAMAQLAQRRAVAVRDYLAAHEVPAERLFLGTAKAPSNEDSAWTPRAVLELAAK